MSNNVFQDNNIRDSFQEMLSFIGSSTLSIKTIHMCEVDKDKKVHKAFLEGDNGENSKLKKLFQFITLDVKTITLWIFDPSRINYKTQILNTYKFGNQQRFISSVIYIKKLKIIIAAALDMTFKIFDQGLKFIESIHHSERAIITIECDQDLGLLIVAGATGVSIWRVLQNSVTLKNSDISFTVEKIFAFKKAAEWVMKLSYQVESKRIYALMDRSVQVYSLSDKTAYTKLENIHDCPITNIIWSRRNQFYVTACSGGLVKCWTSYFVHLSNDNMLPKSENVTSVDICFESDGGGIGTNKFALLHTFRAHSKEVTGLCLHSVPGLAISAGLDGYMKVLNLEAFTEIFSIFVGNGIVNMKTVKFGDNNLGSVFLQTDGTIRFWKIVSCCQFFGTCTENVIGLSAFDDLHIARKEVKRIETIVEGMMGLEGNSVIAQSTDDSIEIEFKQDDDSISDDDNDDKSIISNNRFGNNDKHKDIIETRYIIAAALRDLRVFTSSGTLVCKLEPDAMIDGVKSYCLSSYQQIIIILFENGKVNLYCVRSPKCELLYSLPLKNQDIDKGTFVTLIDTIPRKNNFSSKNDFSKDIKYSLRNEPIPGNLDEVIVLSTASGSVFFYDTFNNCELKLVMQCQHGTISCLRYNQGRSELAILGYDPSMKTMTLKIWRLPEMICTHKITDLENISCFDSSPQLNYFALGNIKGYVQLFTMIDNVKKPNEILRSDNSHNGEVTSINFCDELRIFITSSKDCTINIWNYNKEFIRTIILNQHTPSVVFNGQTGDILLSQRTYVLRIPISIWDNGIVNVINANEDPWIDCVNNIKDDNDTYLLNTNTDPFSIQNTIAAVALAREKQLSLLKEIKPETNIHNSSKTRKLSLKSDTFITESNKVSIDDNISEYDSDDNLIIKKKKEIFTPAVRRNNAKIDNIMIFKAKKKASNFHFNDIVKEIKPVNVLRPRFLNTSRKPSVRLNYNSDYIEETINKTFIMDDRDDIEKNIDNFLYDSNNKVEIQLIKTKLIQENHSIPRPLSVPINLNHQENKTSEQIEQITPKLLVQRLFENHGLNNEIITHQNNSLLLINKPPSTEKPSQSRPLLKQQPSSTIFKPVVDENYKKSRRSFNGQGYGTAIRDISFTVDKITGQTKVIDSKPFNIVPKLSLNDRINEKKLVLDLIIEEEDKIIEDEKYFAMEEEDKLKLTICNEELEKCKQEQILNEQKKLEENKLKNSIESVILNNKIMKLKIQKEILYEDAGINIDGLSKLSQINARKCSLQSLRKLSTTNDNCNIDTTIMNDLETINENEIINDANADIISDNYIIQDNLSNRKSNRKASKSDLLKTKQGTKEFFRLNKFSKNGKKNHLTINEVLNMQI